VGAPYRQTYTAPSANIVIAFRHGESSIGEVNSQGATRPPGALPVRGCLTDRILNSAFGEHWHRLSPQRIFDRRSRSTSEERDLRARWLWLRLAAKFSVIAFRHGESSIGEGDPP